MIGETVLRALRVHCVQLICCMEGWEVLITFFLLFSLSVRSYKDPAGPIPDSHAGGQDSLWWDCRMYWEQLEGASPPSVDAESEEAAMLSWRVLSHVRSRRRFLWSSVPGTSCCQISPQWSHQCQRCQCASFWSRGPAPLCRSQIAIFKLTAFGFFSRLMFVFSWSLVKFSFYALSFVTFK